MSANENDQIAISTARRLGATLERYVTDESHERYIKVWARRGKEEAEAEIVYRFAYRADIGEVGGHESEAEAARAYLRALRAIIDEGIGIAA